MLNETAATLVARATDAGDKSGFLVFMETIIGNLLYFICCLLMLLAYFLITLVPFLLLYWNLKRLGWAGHIGVCVESAAHCFCNWCDDDAPAQAAPYVEAPPPYTRDAVPTAEVMEMTAVAQLPFEEAPAAPTSPTTPASPSEAQAEPESGPAVATEEVTVSAIGSAVV